MARRTAMPAELADTIRNNPPPPPSEDKLMVLRALVSETRDLEQHKADLEEQLKAVNEQLTGNEGMYFNKLPALMTEIGLTVITLEADGNNPAVEAKAGPFYAANIAAGWPEEKRKTAFDWLDSNGHGDLIKTEVTVAFPRDERKAALKFAKVANQYGAASMKEAVPWNTLTSWLREQVEEYGNMPPLDIIGGTVSRSVKLKNKE